MAYRVVNDFTDTKDKNKLYKRGEDYPRGAYKPSTERIEELSSLHPKYNLIFIEEIKEDKPKQTKARSTSKAKTKETDEK